MCLDLCSPGMGASVDGLGGCWLGVYTLSKGSLWRGYADGQLASLIIRAAFWGFFFVGVADAHFICLLKICTPPCRQKTQQNWACPHGGMYIHIPLLILGAFIGFRDKSVSVVWLILLAVIAEMLIAGSFIFAAEQTLGGSVRFCMQRSFCQCSYIERRRPCPCDVIFAGFDRTKVWVNATGSVASGMPLCWLVLVLGMSKPVCQQPNVKL